jgi:MSHA biogenesis protein MshM
MYHRHFGLDEAPFSLTPDTAFFFAHHSAQSALNTLLVALRGGEGFVKVVGEVGCGKTLLCRRLLALLAQDCETAYIPNPALDPKGMLCAVCEELGVPAGRGAGHRLVKSLEAALLAHAAAGRRVVLVIDEAQAIPDATVEVLRLLSNIETEKRKLLQIVLFGQPELDAKLAQPHLRQLLQRISFAERIQPLAPREVREYVGHRLRAAGAGDDPVFDDAALDELSRRSRGVPRLINAIAHKAMMLAFGEGASRIARRHVSAASADTAGARDGPRQSWLQRLWGSAGRSAVS